jgi:hypothetical protein
MKHDMFLTKQIFFMELKVMICSVQNHRLMAYSKNVNEKCYSDALQHLCENVLKSGTM